MIMENTPCSMFMAGLLLANYSMMLVLEKSSLLKKGSELQGPKNKTWIKMCTVLFVTKTAAVPPVFKRLKNGPVFTF